MKLYLLFSLLVFCTLWAMINDDHLPKIKTTTPLSSTRSITSVAGHAPVFTETMRLGEQLFKQNCNACHHRNMIDDLTGPALKGVTQRWADYPPEDLYNWIRNAQKMVQTKHPRATQLYRDWDKKVMTSFTLKDEEVAALLEYMER